MQLSLFTLAFLGDIGGGEMILIFIVGLMLFGGQRLPELARGLGKSVREFKKATAGIEDQIKQAMEDEPVRTKPTPKPTTVYTPAPIVAPTPEPVSPPTPLPNDPTSNP